MKIIVSILSNIPCYLPEMIQTRKTTGVIQLIPPVLSSETLLHISLSSEYSGFRPGILSMALF